MTQTQLMSWEQIKPDLGRRQLEVYGAIKKMPRSNRELSVGLGLPINSITGRVKELRDKGLVCENRVKFDCVTNRMVCEWSIVCNKFVEK